MKKYILFAYDQYYPSGGLQDIVGSYDDLKGVYEAMKGYDFYEIVDRDTWEMIPQAIQA